MITLESTIKELDRVGEARAKVLARLGLKTVKELLFYLPFRYEDFRQTKDIASLNPGESANISGEITLIQNKRSFRKKVYLTEALISDDSDTIKIIWFNQPFLTKNLKMGDRLSLSGKVSEQNGQIVMISPQYEKITSTGLIHTSGLVPNYHLTAALSQKQIRALIKQIIPLSQKSVDWLPETIRKKLKLIPLSAALQKIHFPEDWEDVRLARQRLMFTELFLRQIKSQAIKREIKMRSATEIIFQKDATKTFVDSLPFKLSSSQKKSAWEILQDMEQASPMSRLLEGDVGSGKTIVAAIALLNVALNKKQGVLMVPSEILAEQHYHSLSKILKKYRLKILLLTSGHKAKNQTEIWDADIIIGTQALIQDRVKFRDLALVIVDEQHRFGVKQRGRLLNLPADKTPHFLSMTATPIPRSLALAIYGDLDISIINEMPAGRKPIITDLVLSERRLAAYNFVREQIKNGRQAFVVCPLVEESDKLGVKSATQEYEHLSKDIFPEFSIGLIHGRLKTKEKERIMADFLDNKIKILVSTSVIEVGIDVANASIMLIEGAERFGLATLHQFRGRVGRGEYQSYCLLFPTSDETSNPKTLERLKAMLKYHDGLSLAKIDLKLRGAGELYGLGQSGFPEIQIASLFDYDLIKKAQDEAANIITSDHELKNYPLLREALGEWENSIHLE